MSAPTFQKFSEQTTVVKRYKITDAPPVQKNWSDVTLRPTDLWVTVTDGSVSGVLLSGPKLKRDGSDGALTAETPLNRRHNWPAWLETFISGMGL